MRESRKKYGGVASWAVWENVREKRKSNMGHLNTFDLRKNPSLLEVLKTNVVMVGLNISKSKTPAEPFLNFHPLYSSANDFKIRHAFKDTEFYDAYTTDIIKYYPNMNSREVRAELKQNSKLVQDNISLFRQELSDIGAKEPVLLAFGVDVYNLLNKYLNNSEYSKLIRITHYSHYISMEDYKKEVFSSFGN